jgi:hypothetical protein
VAEKFEMPAFTPPKDQCPACTCDAVPPPADPGYAEAYMAGALGALGLHVPLREWMESLCRTHRAFFDVFAAKCAANQTKWLKEQENK